MKYERPDKYPEWATDALADIVEPSLGQKQLGWLPDDRPPAGWLNWLKHNIYQWAAHLDEVLTMWATNITKQTPQSSANDFVDITYGEVSSHPVVVLVESIRYIQWSRDGKNWNRVEVIAEDIPFSAIHYHDGYFVLVGAGSGSDKNLFYSSNLTSWTNNAQGTAALTGVTYGKGYWVAVGETGTLYYKLGDPTSSWTINSQGSLDLTSVKYGDDDYWVIVGSVGTLLYRIDNPTGLFTSNNIGSADLKALEYGYVDGIGIWVCAPSTTPSGTIYRANDPTGTWSPSYGGANSYIGDIAYGNGLFAVALFSWYGTEYNPAMISRNCVDWVIVRDKTSDTPIMRGVCYGFEQFIFVGNDDLIYTTLRHGIVYRPGY